VKDNNNRLKNGAAILKQTLHAALVPAVLLFVWEGLTRSGFINPQILPAPSQVLLKWIAYLKPLEPYDPANTSYLAWCLSGELPHDALASIIRVVGGFAIGAGMALPLGLLMGGSAWIYQLMNPLVQLLRPIPPIAYIPLAILWFGLGNPPAFFLISLGAFFPVLMNTISGVRTVDVIYIRAARNLGASGATLFLRVILPAATPHILTGLRVGFGVAFIVVIVAEMIAVNNGLGFRILEAREFMWSDKIIAGMITIGLLGLAIDTGMDRINRYLLRWHRGIDQ
jgi:NitT/TauT family transport system permease protein